MEMEEIKIKLKRIGKVTELELIDSPAMDKISNLPLYEVEERAKQGHISYDLYNAYLYVWVNLGDVTRSSYPWFKL